MPQDYSGQNLRGRSFKGQNLEGANFSGADIRSADFTGANLRGANFTGANLKGANFSNTDLRGVKFNNIKAGFVYYRIIITILLSLIMTITASKFTFFPIFFLYYNYICLCTFPLCLFFQNTIEIYFEDSNLDDWLNEYRKSKIKWGYISLVSWLLSLSISSIAKSLIIYNQVFNKDFLPISAILLVLLSCIESLICICFPSGISKGYWGADIVSRMPGISFTLGYILDIIEGKTNFQDADLTDADFSGANLVKASFKGALITRVKWFKVESPKPSLKKSQLKWHENARILTKQLLISGNGSNKNFDYMDLSSTNLSDANLTYASFVGTDLSHSNLQNANLTGANLKQVKLEGTDLTGATLTGAYIQDWGITTDTKFDGVRCEYVYMRLPTKENPDPLRKPDNNKEVFGDGEFGDFIQPIFDTLDLYHNQGVDPRAIAISFKELAENHPEADLRIVGMEVRGEDKFLLRAKTAATADKSELSAEYFDTYNEIKALPEREIKLLLEEKDSRIRSLENFVNQALQRPNFYSSTQIEKVNTMTNNPGGISQNVSGGNVSGGMQAAQGNNNVQTSTTYSSPEQKQNLAEAAAEIQQLLEQLSQSYPTNTNSEKMVFAIEAKKHVENNPTLMKKIISALEAGGTAALEQLLSHPAASFVIGAFEDFKNNSK